MGVGGSPPSRLLPWGERWDADAVARALLEKDLQQHCSTGETSEPNFAFVEHWGLDASASSFCEKEYLLAWR